MVISEQAHDDFRRHVLASYPNEACGVLVNDEYVPCDNVADQPKTNFRISAQQLVLIGATRGRVQAILHSHAFNSRSPPKWPAVWPSYMDMTQWLASDIPWGITATEGENLEPLVWLDEDTIAPLEGRPFVHGIWDCYSAVRDWYRLEKHLTIRNFPRGMEWWERGMDLYQQNFGLAGFVEVPRGQIEVGDACLIRVMAPVINHAAVITGTNEILHHLGHRYSAKDAFNKWERHVVKFVRYVGEDHA